MWHPAEDDLALLALGEPLDPSLTDVRAHVTGCDSCDREVAALAAAARAARAAGVAVVPAAPDAVWARVVDELGLRRQPERPGPTPVAGPDGPAAQGRRSGRRSRSRRPPQARRRPLTTAAGLAGVAVAAAGVAVAAVLLATPAAERVPAGSPAVPLVALSGLPAQGRVALAAGRDALVVDTAGLPAAGGFYEVWLLDESRGRALALGVLDGAGRARLTLPAGVDAADYPQVDVSLEPQDGDPAHSGASVLRGNLPG